MTIEGSTPLFRPAVRRQLRTGARSGRRLLVQICIGSLIVLLAGCAGGPAEPERYAPAEALQGTWRWVSSLDVNTQQLHTPESEGFDAVLVFTAESERAGTFVYRKTGAPEVAGEFGIGSEDTPGNDFLVLDHSIDFLESAAWLAAGADSLWLGGVMEGGYDSRYVRISKEDAR